ncbi:hypothetical protein [Acidipropionibacterium jensenii]|uniref:hypothetical protein n=1 Tax=Acidipropionibacterium jensenii TaxID=1749 RepID=UPI00214AA6DD|nr:hypothetical protein [Acidipropionibacterium jensenii]
MSASLVASGAAASTAGHPSDDTPPDLVSALGGYFSVWQPSGANDLHGTVKDPTTLQWNDRLTSWINQNATKDQQFRALQNSAYKGNDGSGYDQSISIADGLGASLGRIYAQGRVQGRLPKVDALINSENGTAGAFVGTGQAKATFSYPRPFLPASPTSTPVAGDEAACAPKVINASSVTPNRTGRQWANPDGSLRITRVPAAVDTTRAFASTDVSLDPGYGAKGICTGGSFPSGHTTTAYQAGITLATRWSDARFRTEVLLPARQELVSYLQAQCGDVLAKYIARGHRLPRQPLRREGDPRRHQPDRHRPVLGGEGLHRADDLWLHRHPLDHPRRGGPRRRRKPAADGLPRPHRCPAHRDPGPDPVRLRQCPRPLGRLERRILAASQPGGRHLGDRADQCRPIGHGAVGRRTGQGHQGR